MTRTEFRTIILSSPLNERLNFEVEEKNYPMIRQEVVKARNMGFGLTFKSKRQSTGERFCLLLKTKQGDSVEYKIKVGL